MMHAIDEKIKIMSPANIEVLSLSLPLATLLVKVDNIRAEDSILGFHHYNEIPVCMYSGDEEELSHKNKENYFDGIMKQLAQFLGITKFSSE